MTRRRNIVVDARGLRCPVPLLLLARAVTDLTLGDEVEVLGDDPDIERDLEAWCAEGGHRLLAVSHHGELVSMRLEIASLPTPA